MTSKRACILMNIPILPQDTNFRAITVLSIQGALMQECGHLSNQCNAVEEALRSSRRAGLKMIDAALNCLDVGQLYLRQFALSQSFFSPAET